ncbi:MULTISPECIES: hypothetical protein [Bacillaceae]|uniref:hypothetical protein n=1 Tax=Bacillaceae TaxID=186817 RepID=UPI000C795005|nr:MULTISPECIES: hypothetical protein [Bacillaceae]PLR68139.1 hypothetical protein CYJ36_08475 [Bacillus sp. UMB0893]QNG61214.1 hypothetical protein H4O14_06975 [Bacillus sp. PAMC26568]
MEIIIIALFVVSILLIGISFFQRDQVKDIEQELDHLSVSSMQEIYKLKKKVRVLEEEILQNDLEISEDDSIDPQTLQRIVMKHNQGLSNEAIARSEYLSEEEIESILKQNERVLT